MKRLKVIAKLIAPYQAFADIGCDHGYLIKYAFAEGVQFAQAIDNKKAPLENAKNNLLNYGNSVIFSLSDGLEAIAANIKCVVLAGLGGLNIKNIFTKSLNKLKNVERIIVSPHNNAPEVRELLSNQNFKITFEDLIYEDGHYYELIVFDKGKVQYSKEELFFGPLNLVNKSPIWIEKWQKVYNRLQDKSHPQVIKKYNYIKNNVPVQEETNE